MKNKSRFCVDNLPNSHRIELDEYLTNRPLTPEELDKLNLERERNDNQHSR